MSPATLGVLWQHAHRQPTSLLEYVGVAIAAVAMAYALVRAVQMTFRPGENEPNHIKRTILEDEPGGPGRTAGDRNRARQ